MFKKFVMIGALALATSAHADSWTGADKGKHLMAGAAIASLTTVMSQSEMTGFLIGAAAGVGKEVWDGKNASAKDLAVTLVGAYIGAKVGGLLITPYSITYSLRV